MSDTTYRVLDQYRENSDYADEVGKRYHFGEKHHSLLDVPGTPFVYYEPGRNGAGEYFGCGVLGNITEDPSHSKPGKLRFFVDLLNYQPFPVPVSAVDSKQQRREPEPYFNPQNAVRRISRVAFTAICSEAGIQFNAGNPPDGALHETAPEPAPRKYWTFSPGHQAEHWEDFYRTGIMAIGWDEMGDLGKYHSKDEIRKEYQTHWPTDSDPKNDIHALWQFSRDIHLGDIIFVNQGRTTLLGYGVVEGDYQFDTSRSYYKHIRKVRWLGKCQAEVPKGTTLHGKTLTDISDDPSFVKRHATTVGLDLESAKIPAPARAQTLTVNPVYTIAQLADETGLQTTILERWVRAIERKGQAVLYGPPGTGKTFLAQKLAQHLIGGGDGLQQLVQFHPAYAYEDFMQGLRPKRVPGGLDYPLEQGRFLDFCERASKRTGVSVLIIDEINRANLARVFGELMYLLEYRGSDNDGIPLAGGGRFRIPTNVRLIGTMNTADRSIALVDHALRRRFAFLQLAPDYEVLRRFHEREKTKFPVEYLIKQLTILNTAINDPHYSLGISFFLRQNLAAELPDIWSMEVEPYLEEYFFDQREKFQQFRWEKVSPNIPL